MIAYHFTGATLRDGSPIPAIGKKLVHEGELNLCVSGYHASVDPFDAMQYALGPLLHLVVVGGRVITDDDKLVASERTILASIDATELLRKFACWCALEVVNLWDCPPVVLEYLQTGDESLRSAARAAAENAAENAAETAARAAAWSATGAAAQDAAWGAAEDAAEDAARVAAWDAARAAARAAARGAAGEAAWEAAWNAAWNAAREEQRAEFNRRVQEAFR